MCEVYIDVICNLSELEALSNVKYLLLSGVTIDDVSGLKNMGELIHVAHFPQPKQETFTDQDIEKIKEMYPECIINP